MVGLSKCNQADDQSRNENSKDNPLLFEPNVFLHVGILEGLHFQLVKPQVVSLAGLSIDKPFNS